MQNQTKAPKQIEHTSLERRENNNNKKSSAMQVAEPGTAQFCQAKLAGSSRLF